MFDSQIPTPTILKNRHHAPKPTSAEDIRKDVEWIQLHHQEYQGQWIALHKGVLLGANKSLVALHNAIESTGQLKNSLFISLA
jgi:hypothetical protein